MPWWERAAFDPVEDLLHSVTVSAASVIPLIMVFQADVAAELRARARERGTSVSKVLVEIVTRDVRRAWPEGWLDRVASAWREPWPTVDDPPPEGLRPL